MNSLLAGAHGVILSHNHPSGSNKASNSDIKSTKGLKLLDIFYHIILTNTCIIYGRRIFITIGSLVGYFQN